MLQIRKQKNHGAQRKPREAAVAMLAVALLLSVSIIARSTVLLPATTATRDLAILPTDGLLNMQQSSTALPQKHICFITAQFASSASDTDRLFDVHKTVPIMAESPYFHFFAFSNLADLSAPGWEIVVKQFDQQYKRFITQSRWPKFQAFKDPTIQQRCDIVFYIDGIISPYDLVDDFQAEAQKIMSSPVQFAQRLHSDGGGAEAEIKRIKRQKKDIKQNIQASLKWLQAQPDYNGNCTLYENNMYGYSIHSETYQKAANFFWDHYSKEEDSWRDQPLWCYTLDHFNITPLVLSGNGKGTLFDKSLKRMRKGGHRYRSENAVSSSPNQTQEVEKIPSCWLDFLDGDRTGNNKPKKTIPNTTIGDDSSNLVLRCPDAFRRDMAPHNRTNPGITIGIPYYAAPATLLQQLDSFAKYSAELQQQMTIIIVDDGSPSGLQASEYLPDGERLQSFFDFRLRIVRITSDIAWNIEGSRNLAFYLADTRRGLMLDLDMLLPPESLEKALQWPTIKPGNATHPSEIAVAHKFNRRKPKGKESVQPALAVLDIPEYWNAGGLDEDFAGHYGFGTEPHFWHQWKKGPRETESHKDTYILEVDTDACDAKLLGSQEAIDRCQAAREKLPKLDRDKRRNKSLWRKKKSGQKKWINSYLRFNWTIDR